MKKTPFKIRKPWNKKSTKPLKRTRIRIKGKSTASELKREIQSLLRSVAILRDGGCVFRNFPQSGNCGGRNKKGELTLQGDHLHSRVHAVSFGDSRLCICVCPRHHLFYKRQYPAEYEKIARKVIGKERTKLLDRVREDWRPYKMDWVLVKLGLEKEIRNLNNK